MENDSCRIWTGDRSKDVITGKKLNARQNESEEENGMIVAALRGRGGRMEEH